MPKPRTRPIALGHSPAEAALAGAASRVRAVQLHGRHAAPPTPRRPARSKLWLCWFPSARELRSLQLRVVNLRRSSSLRRCVVVRSASPLPGGLLLGQAVDGAQAPDEVAAVDADDFAVGDVGLQGFEGDRVALGYRRR